MTADTEVRSKEDFYLLLGNSQYQKHALVRKKSVGRKRCEGSKETAFHPLVVQPLELFDSLPSDPIRVDKGYYTTMTPSPIISSHRHAFSPQSHLFTAFTPHLYRIFH